jgi:hypothetical protein
MLLKAGFMPREVEAWVQKPSIKPGHANEVPEHANKMPSLASAQSKSLQNLGEQPPREGGAGGAGSEAYRHGLASNSMPRHALGTNGMPQGYAYAQLEAMPDEELTSLGFVRMQDGIYRYI